MKINEKEKLPVKKLQKAVATASIAKNINNTNKEASRPTAANKTDANKAAIMIVFKPSGRPQRRVSISPIITTRLIQENTSGASLNVEKKIAQLRNPPSIPAKIPEIVERQIMKETIKYFNAVY
jgi:hypothetical protein